MLLHGHVANPFITGSSVHNQRIERLWRDTYRCVLSLYYQMFYYLEDTGNLNPLSQVDLFCLHYVYVHRINTSLQLFANGWNNHAMTSEHGMTPAKMFTAGTILSGRAHTMAAPTLSCDSDMPSDTPSAPSIEVPSTDCPLTEEQYEELNSVVDDQALTSNDYGIDLYNFVRSFVLVRVQ